MPVVFPQPLPPLPDATLTSRGAVNNAAPPQIALSNLSPAGAAVNDSVVWSGTAWVPQAASALAADNKNMVARLTTGDGQLACNLPVAAATVPGWVVVAVNGVTVEVGDGVKTLECYFSKDGGTTATTYGALTSADYLYWNGSIAGYQLDTTDTIDFTYLG